MKKVNVQFKFVTSQFIKEIRELSFEAEEVDLRDYQQPEDNYIYEGEIKGLYRLSREVLPFSGRIFLGSPGNSFI